MPKRIDFKDLFNQAKKFIKDKNYTEAIKVYTKLIECLLILKNEDKINLSFIYNNRGSAHANLKEYDKAIKDYSKAIELDPKLAGSYNNLGNVHFNLKNYDESIKDYSKAIELDPKLADPYINRGIVYYYLKNYGEVIKNYSKAIELDPKLAVAYNNRGLTYADLKEYDKAIDDYNKAIELDPKFAEPYNNRGIAYYYLKEYDKAIDDYNKAIELDPKFAEPYCNIIQYYFSIGNYVEVRRYIKKGSKIDEVKNNYPFIDNSNLFKIAENPFDEDKIKEARDGFKRGLELKKDDKFLKRNLDLTNILLEEDDYEFESTEKQIKYIFKILSDSNEKKVFISYAHSTKEYEKKVLQVALALELNEIGVYIDAKLRVGDDIIKFMKETKCKIAILMLDKNYIKKINAEENSGAKIEFERFALDGIKILPLHMDDCNMDYFKSKNLVYADFSSDEQTKWELAELISAIKEII